MSFVTPWALLGLLAAAVPIVLHLVRRRDPQERVFPALQYLDEATREHRRRLQLRNWALLACRTGLITALVLAAAGPSLPRAVPLGRHSAAALALVVDNSASSSLVVEGTPVLRSLTDAAHKVLARATAADRLWLLLADGVVRSGTAADLSRRLEAMQPGANRMDLGAAIRQGRDLVRASGRAGEVVVLTDGQASALSDGGDGARVIVLRPGGESAHNVAIASLDPGPQPWGPAGGRMEVVVASDDSSAVATTVSVDGNMRRELLLTPGVPGGVKVSPSDGWRIFAATIPADEFLFDNHREVAVRVAPAVSVRWDSRDRFIATALEVLIESGRLRQGNGVTVGSLGPGPSIVVPPDDPALVGALNRNLAARGIAGQYGGLILGPAATDSGAPVLADPVEISRRHAIEPAGGAVDTLVTVDGAPWLVRSGEVLLLGSRLEPEWTALPLRASFVPFLDALAARAVRGEPTLSTVVAGEPLRLPTRVTAIGAAGGTPVPVEGDATWIPRDAGVYWLLDGVDTVGALSVAIDPRESDLRRASAEQLESLWSGAIVAGLDEVGHAFTASGRGDLRPLLLVIALLLLIGESALARGTRVG